VRITILLLGLLLLLLLQAVEVWRRIRHPNVLTVRQFWRRMITAGILEVSLFMWLVGEALMRRQPPLTQFAYWMAALLLGIAAAFSAMRELTEVSRQYHHQRAELFRNADAEGTIHPLRPEGSHEASLPRNGE
jgi:hypothetical protein